MSIVLGGQRFDVPGVVTVSYLDDPQRVPRTTDVNPRRVPPQMICAHTTSGLRGSVLQGCAASSDTAFSFARYQAVTDREVSWDFTVGRDGTVTWSNDPLVSYTWHATTVNPRSIGFEMAQDPDGTLYACQIEAAYKVIVFLCAALSIQAQTPTVGGVPDSGVIPRVESGGADVVGIIGHRNVTTNRGPGDPGNAIFDKLLSERFAGFDFRTGQDLLFWREQQRALGLPQTGVPNRTDAEALQRLGRPFGMAFGPWQSNLGLGRSWAPAALAGLTAASVLAYYAHRRGWLGPSIASLRAGGQAAFERARSRLLAA